MQVSSIGSVKHSGNHVNFQRRLRPDEEKDYRNNVLQPAFDYLGTEEVAMIIHGSCYPEANKDVGVGSPYGKVAEKLIPFEMLHGFNSNQLGPVGVLRNAQSVSPYESSVFTKNYLFIDFNELTTDKYAKILSPRVINSVFDDSTKNGENYAYSKFPDAFANYDYCIKSAYKTFREKVNNKDPKALALSNEYDDFKRKKGNAIYKEALFDVLEKTYATDKYEKWDEIDKNLISLLEKGDVEAQARYRKVVHRSKEDFDTYIFGQFILDKQVKENNKIREKLGFKYISDLLVGFSKSDEWANQDLFLKDYKMGCPYGGKHNGPQLWDIPVLDPNKFFNPDGSLAAGGKFLKAKMQSALEDFDNVRIDHALGLIDPYIYDKNSVRIVDGYVDMDRFRGNNVSYLPHIDPNGNYKNVLNKIILPTLNEYGIANDYPVWEDLSTNTPTFDYVYREKNHLPGITQLEWVRAENSQDPGDWGLVGSHDSSPARQMIEKDWIRNHDAWNIFYLAGFLNSNPNRAHQRDEYCKKIGSDPVERVKAKFAELFLTCNKIQISFADFFGINKTYNIGGSQDDKNWKLRLNEDFEDTYYKNLSSEHPTAINMPEILKLAVQAKADMNNVKRAHDLNLHDSEIPAENDYHVQQMLDNLDKYQKILEEPEE